MSFDNFYTIIDQGEKEDASGALDNPVRKFIFTLQLNPDHPIYKGHFPGNPVVPGVCQVQIVKELVSEILETDLVICKSDNIKFLSMIVPSVNTLINVSIEMKEKEPGFWHITSVITNQGQVFLKFKGVMRPV